MDAKSWIQEIRAAGKLMAAGDLAGAENRYRQLLDKGTDNPLHKALALDGLGRAVFEQGRQAEAIEAIEAAVSLLRERQGVQDPATCGALQNLGRLYLAAGQVEKSIAVSREAVDGLRAGFGEDHPLVAGAMMRLSACLYMQRDLDGAEALLLKARDVFEKQSGDESRMDVSTCLNNLGRIHEERGDLEQGIALHRQAVAIRKELLGDHTETAFSLGNLGVALATAGQWQEAVDTLQEALDCYARAGHTTGPDIEGYRKNLEICRRARSATTSRPHLFEDDMKRQRGNASWHFPVFCTGRKAVVMGRCLRLTDSRRWHEDTDSAPGAAGRRSPDSSGASAKFVRQGQVPQRRRRAKASTRMTRARPPAATGRASMASRLSPYCCRTRAAPAKMTPARMALRPTPRH